MNRFDLREAAAWLQNWPDGLIAISGEGKVLYTTLMVQRILGFKSEDICGRLAHEVLCAHSRGATHKVAQCPLCANKSQAVQSCFWLSSDGVNVSIDYRIISLESPTETHSIISFQSNSERQHNQEEMDKFAEYVDKSPAPIGEFDLDGQLLFGNTALQEQLLDQGVDDLGSACIFPTQVARICKDSWEQQSAISHVDVHVAGKWLGWHFYPINVGEEASIMGYAFDITDQKNAETQVQAEKANARRDFYAKMVHELRTPLNAIIGFSQLLEKRLAGGGISERDYASLKAIRAAGLQLNELISDTLDISKIEAGKMDVQKEHFTVNKLFASFEDQLKGLADNKNLDYRVEWEENLQCYSDPKKIRQIVINLISNAIKYTPKGSVEVSFTLHQHPVVGASICCTVRDTGLGIPQDQIDKLFVAYQQVSEEKNKGIQGTGLGLALVAELVGLLSGDIQVESKVGEGSVFRVYWPTE